MTFMAGIEGQQKIADMITSLRETPLTEISGWKALSVTDYMLN